MGGYVDSYCERIAPGFWGEPFNSASNLAFLVAAIAVWLLARRAGRGYPLAVLIGLVFLGSAAFHTTATRWGAALDTGFIAVFLLYYIALFAHLFWEIPWRLAWLAAPAFLAFTVLVTLAASAVDFGGPGVYVAALLGLAILAGALGRSAHADRRPYWRAFAVAGVVFASSLTLRTIDSAVCAGLPIGTHFLWHILNACTLFLVSRIAITRSRETAAA